MELVDEPPAKWRRLQLGADNFCLFCLETLTRKVDRKKCQHQRKDVIWNPKIAGLQTILSAAEKRKDQVYERIWPNRYEILSGTKTVVFHKACRASYTSTHNIDFVVKGEEPPPPVSPDEPPRLRRADTAKFKIGRDCFVCGKAYKRRAILTPISTGDGEKTRQRMLDASEKRNDREMHLRILAHTDFFAKDAKYHRTCYSEYISERNINAARRRNSTSLTDHDIAFTELCKDIEDTVLSKKTTVVFLSDLFDKYVQLLKARGIDDTEAYRSWKLKERLKNHYRDRIVFISRTGQSDLVCSSVVTLGDALKKVNQLQVIVDEKAECEVGDIVEECDNTILHMAAGIIRKGIQRISFQVDEYVPSSEIDIEKCKAFVPGVLLDFISWCTSKECYQKAIGYTQLG